MSRLPVTLAGDLCFLPFSFPLRVPLVYARYTDPTGKHANISASSCRTLTFPLAELASYQRDRIPCLIRTSTTCVGRCVLRLHRSVWCRARGGSPHAATKHVPRGIGPHTGLYQIFHRRQIRDRLRTGRRNFAGGGEETTVRGVDRQVGTQRLA